MFEELNVEVYAVSLDDVVDLAKFAEAQELNFQLLSDPDGSVATKYGVLPDGGRAARRITFIIDDEGVLRLVDQNVNVRAHGTDLLDMVVDLQG